MEHWAVVTRNLLPGSQPTRLIQTKPGEPFDKSEISVSERLFGPPQYAIMSFLSGYDGKRQTVVKREVERTKIWKDAHPEPRAPGHLTQARREDEEKLPLVFSLARSCTTKTNETTTVCLSLSLTKYITIIGI